MIQTTIQNFSRPFTLTEEQERYITARGGHSLVGPRPGEDVANTFLKVCDPAVIKSFMLLGEEPFKNQGDVLAGYDDTKYTAARKGVSIESETHHYDDEEYVSHFYRLRLEPFISEKELSDAFGKEEAKEMEKMLAGLGVLVTDSRTPDRDVLTAHSREHIEKEMKYAKALISGLNGTEISDTGRGADEGITLTCKTANGTEVGYDVVTDIITVTDPNGKSFSGKIASEEVKNFLENEKDGNVREIAEAFSKAGKEADEYFKSKNIDLLDISFDDGDQRIRDIGSGVLASPILSDIRFSFRFENDTLSICLLTERGVSVEYSEDQGLYVDGKHMTAKDGLKNVKDPDVFLIAGIIDDVNRQHDDKALGVENEITDIEEAYREEH